jgi:hypothetical protein
MYYIKQRPSRSNQNLAVVSSGGADAAEVLAVGSHLGGQSTEYSSEAAVHMALIAKGRLQGDRRKRLVKRPLVLALVSRLASVR